MPLLGTPKQDGFALPPITVAQLRRACKSFETATAVGIEGLRPRHVLLLSDAGLEVLARLFQFVEESGLPPVRGSHIVFPPKPTGGERPIGVLAALYRIWCRCRRYAADRWEEEDH